MTNIEASLGQASLSPRLACSRRQGERKGTHGVHDPQPRERVRFPSDAQLARHAGVAPLEASSGKHRRHRLDRGGNRQLNRALHQIAITQARIHPPAHAHMDRKQAEGKSRHEALRSLKRHLARTIHTTLKNEPPLT